MSKIEVNQISSQCGSTLTIGQSGDTVTLACGATQTGFGRSGSVNWDTTAKTASFTAVSGNGYFVNTTSGAITVTLPASPSAGDIVSIADYARTFATNNVTVGRNGSLIQSAATDATLSTNGQSTTFVYVDGTQGWVPTEDQTTGNYGALYITATGGTITTSGDYKIHTFTGPGTFCVSCGGNAAGSNSVDYVVVAGGGSGRVGGGAAGGYRESHSVPVSGCYTASPLATPTSLPVTATGYPITVGSGGAGGTNPCSTPTSGSNSVFSTITSTGGGGGGSYLPTPSPVNSGVPGGSGGGGGAYNSPSNVIPGGTGNTPPVSPPQGSSGGNGSYEAATHTAGGGGGGAGAAGTPAPAAGGPCTSSVGGPGGNGVASGINATATTRAGGGGGGSNNSVAVATGGTGGGGNGGSPGGPTSGTSGTANTGGGGGGNVTGSATYGAGGSGIVIIRYKYQ